MRVALASLVPPGAASAAATKPSSIGESNELALTLGRLGPRLIAASVIEPVRFGQACAQSGAPLDDARRRILDSGSDDMTRFDASNAHFLLNLFWAAGLANVNPLLTQGPMMQYGVSRIPNYASTGGWTLGSKPVMEIYARIPLIELNERQQNRVEEVAAGVFRPCCDNPTSFPDCNHGMAMLGLLALLAADDWDVGSLFLAAKTANGFWFPQQSAQLAKYVEASRSVEYRRFDAREAMGRGLFSGSGFRKVVAWLDEHGLGTAPGAARCAA